MRRAVGPSLLALALASTAAGSSTGPGNAVLTCRESIYPAGVGSKDRVLFGTVALPRAMLRLELVPSRTLGAWGFAKHGFVVLQTRRATLTVPLAYRSRYLLGAAYVTGNVPSITLRACPADHLGSWTAWAGGYAAPRPVCAPLLVRAGSRVARVLLAIGRNCQDSRYP